MYVHALFLVGSPRGIHVNFLSEFNLALFTYKRSEIRLEGAYYSKYLSYQNSEETD